MKINALPKQTAAKRKDVLVRIPAVKLKKLRKAKDGMIKTIGNLATGAVNTLYEITMANIKYTKTAMEELTSEPFISTGIGNNQIALWSPWTKPNIPDNR